MFSPTAEDLVEDAWRQRAGFHLVPGEAAASMTSRGAALQIGRSRLFMAVFSSLSGHLVGSRIGAPWFLTKNTTNLAGRVSLAFRPTV